VFRLLEGCEADSWRCCFSVTVLDEECEDDGGTRTVEDSGIGGDGEVKVSSGFAIRRPPRASDKLMSPLIAAGFLEGKVQSFDARGRQRMVDEGSGLRRGRYQESQFARRSRAVKSRRPTQPADVCVAAAQHSG
jgi:hypothetical protein